jgi:hypothetical protein
MGYPHRPPGLPPPPRAGVGGSRNWCSPSISRQNCEGSMGPGVSRILSQSDQATQGLPCSQALSDRSCSGKARAVRPASHQTQALEYSRGVQGRRSSGEEGGPGGVWELWVGRDHAWLRWPLRSGPRSPAGGEEELLGRSMSQSGPPARCFVPSCPESPQRAGGPWYGLQNLSWGSEDLIW